MKIKSDLAWEIQFEIIPQVIVSDNSNFIVFLQGADFLESLGLHNFSLSNNDFKIDQKMFSTLKNFMPGGKDFKSKDTRHTS